MGYKASSGGMLYSSFTPLSRPGEVGANPGNNLHVSGLSSKVDNKDLESAFTKYGKVCE